ncbi:glycosyltransferase [Salinimicrobium oceani]|uniref:Glycosyltransferase n=1 Tax=Salinimicrobium oceani TaxID=2722702 RepID=A0ABX1CVP3_9FLAO|nr:glycosyltransferase [Salinimicrobium oceani]NJW52360.1 glycosyltransferase [Salinimicrobium oceani]
MIAAAVIITLLYALAMLFLLYGFFQVPQFSGKNSAPKTHFSIVIPYRNEAENLQALYESLLKLKYPAEMFEILAVDDASEDNSAALWEGFRKEHPQLNIRLLHNIRKTGSPKKDALALAISASEYDYILTTDADCLVPQAWLEKFNSILEETGAKAIAAPVALKTEVAKMTFLRGFQEMDVLSLQAATIGGFGVDLPFMCNGANFCYSKKAFLEVNGFEGNQEFAGGDDIFLLEKFRQKGLRSVFLKSPEAIVQTSATGSWAALFSQRVRWAAKAAAYKSDFSRGMGLLVFLMNFLLVMVMIRTMAAALPVWLLSFMFIIKFNIDFILIYNSAKFFDREHAVKSYFFSSIVYPFFSSWVVINSVFSGFRWKGRAFKK